MKEQITLRELSCYLPYGLKIQIMGEWTDFENKVPKVFEMVGLGSFVEYHEIGRTVTDEAYYSDVFPLLRNLSDLTKEIEHNGERFVPVERLNDELYAVTSYEYNSAVFNFEGGITQVNLLAEPLEALQKLYEWKFNVFNLPQNLWIDINTLPDNPYK